MTDTVAPAAGTAPSPSAEPAYSPGDEGLREAAAELKASRDAERAAGPSPEQLEKAHDWLAVRQNRRAIDGNYV